MSQSVISLLHVGPPGRVTWINFLLVLMIWPLLSSDGWLLSVRRVSVSSEKLCRLHIVDRSSILVRLDSACDFGIRSGVSCLHTYVRHEEAVTRGKGSGSFVWQFSSTQLCFRCGPICRQQHSRIGIQCALRILVEAPCVYSNIAIYQTGPHYFVNSCRSVDPKWFAAKTYRILA